MVSHTANVRRSGVVIIGTGFAGLAAAIEASKTMDVVLIEKMDKIGGNSVMNAGQISAVGSAAQRIVGIEDSVERMMKDMLKAGVDLNHPNLIRKMILESNDVLEWTKRELNVQYRDRVTQLGGHSIPRTLSTLNASGHDLIDPMYQLVQNNPRVEIMLNCSFDKLFMSDNGKKVIGVHVIHKEGGVRETILCQGGVVLAAGGFSADVKFRSIQCPTFDVNVMTTNQPGATAEVLKESMKVGAMSVQLSRIQLGPWTSPDEEGFGLVPFFCMGAAFPYGITVDPETSQRFVNELGDRNMRSSAILKRGHPVVCFTDSEGAKHSLKDVEELGDALQKFDTIDDLSKAYGMNHYVLKHTVDVYNEGVIKKEDAFGKPLRDDLLPIVVPPFYACRLWPKVHHCMGGVQINEEAEVQHIDGYSIGNLYAAGEITGGVHGGDRLGSCATLDCLVFGRIAGRNAANAKG